MALRVLSATLFSPRGGSAHVARALANGLRERGCSVTHLSGSRSDLDGSGDAVRFYGEVRPVSFDAALASGEPMRFEGPAGTAPMHPSFEDRAGAPDVVFAKLGDDDFERQARAWARELERAGADGADVLHLHHLTPINEAAARVAPDVPVVSQLHGTELLMLERIEAGPPASWPHARRWAQRLRAWGRRCARLLASPAGVERAASLLRVPRDHVVALPNGVDTKRFRPRQVDREALWRRVLAEEPRGWLPGQEPGSARYSEAAAARLAAGTVLVYVGRFTAVKRLDLLIGAFAQARKRFAAPAGLVLVGGNPGEWEREHPAEIVARLGAPDVFLAGWYSHEELPELLAAADVVVHSSEREQFGQAIVEGMACGLPPVATRSLGPETLIEAGRTGWLVDGGADGLAAALVEAVNDAAERERRGAAARAAVCETLSLASVTARLQRVLEEAAGRDRP